MMRQIAYEVDKTLTDQLTVWEPGDTSARA